MMRLISRARATLYLGAILTALIGCHGGVGSGGDARGGPVNDTDPGEGPPAGDAWSDPETWGGSVPAAGDQVTIPHGKTVLLDVDTAALGGLSIEGALVFDDADLKLSSQWILVKGTLRIGSEPRPYTNEATITLDDPDPDSDPTGMGTRGIIVVAGGALELHGAVPVPVWTRLGDHAEPGATSLSLTQSVDWKAGDSVLLTPTDFWNRAETEVLELASVDGETVTVADPVRSFRWGKLQYVGAEGMTLEETTAITDQVLDERAEIGNLTRRIVIQAPDDAAWQDEGFGAHVMLTHGATAHIEGVRLRRAGQRGKMGRYPLHWHVLSYAGGEATGDVDGLYMRGNVVTESANRCITIHATNGATIKDNICYDIMGHGLFMEDAVERRNVIEGNLIVTIRNPEEPLLNHEGGVFQGGSSAFWLTNPDNIVRGNVGVDAEGVGFWLSFPEMTLGLHKDVDLVPSSMALGVFDDNVAHSNQIFGLNLDWVTADDEGSVTERLYMPTSDGEPDRLDNLIRFELHRFVTYKHWDGGMWNRAVGADYLDWRVADNGGVGFAGAGQVGNIENCLIVGRSLNDDPALERPPDPPVAAASYHSEYEISNNLIVNFPYVQGQVSGAFATGDYYTSAVDMGLIRNANNVLIESHPGYRVRPILADNWTLAGALWDPYGYWGEAGRYWIYDDPFLKTGTTCDQVAPATRNGLSCEGPFYGVGSYMLDHRESRYLPTMPIEATRYNDSDAVIGRWTVGDGALAPKLSNMRHFAAFKGGRYILRFPGVALATDVSMAIGNAYRDDDAFLLAVEYDGSAAPAAYLTNWDNYEEVAAWAPNNDQSDHVRRLTRAASRQEVIDGSGNLFWQDTAQNLVWLKITGGLPPSSYDEPGSLDYQYQTMFLRIYVP